MFYFAGIVFKRGTNDGRVVLNRFIDLNNKENGDPDRGHRLDPVGRRQGHRPGRDLLRRQALDRRRRPARRRAHLQHPEVRALVPGGRDLRGLGPHLQRHLRRHHVLPLARLRRHVERAAQAERPEVAGEPGSRRSRSTRAPATSTSPGAGSASPARARSRTRTPSSPSAPSARGRSSRSPRLITHVRPLRAGPGRPLRFRTEAFPTMTSSVDASGTRSWTHIAWAQRGAERGRPDRHDPRGRSPRRPRPTTSGTTRSTAGRSRPIPSTRPRSSTARRATPSPRGHQFMPALTFSQGKLVARLLRQPARPHPHLLQPAPVAGPVLARRAAAGRPTPTGAGTTRSGDRSASGPASTGGPTSSTTPHDADAPHRRRPHGHGHRPRPTRPSRAPRSPACPSAQRGDELDLYAQRPGGGVRRADRGGGLRLASPRPALRRLQDLQVNPPNLPMFKNGTIPFIGDYIDVQGPMFVRTATGWAFDTAPTSAPVFHAVWTSNQDVVPPLDGDWTRYTPPARAAGTVSVYDPGQTARLRLRSRVHRHPQPERLHGPDLRRARGHVAAERQGPRRDPRQDLRGLGVQRHRSREAASSSPSAACPPASCASFRPGERPATPTVHRDDPGPVRRGADGVHEPRARHRPHHRESGHHGRERDRGRRPRCRRLRDPEPAGAHLRPLAARGRKRVVGRRREARRAAERRQPLLREPLEREPVQREPVERQPLQREPVERQPLQRQPLEREPVQRQPPNTSIDYANLSNFTLEAAHLSNANLSNANLSNANLSNATSPTPTCPTRTCRTPTCPTPPWRTSTTRSPTPATRPRASTSGSSRRTSPPSARTNRIQLIVSRPYAKPIANGLRPPGAARQPARRERGHRRSRPPTRAARPRSRPSPSPPGRRSGSRSAPTSTPYEARTLATVVAPVVTPQGKPMDFDDRAHHHPADWAPRRRQVGHPVPPRPRGERRHGAAHLEPGRRARACRRASTRASCRRASWPGPPDAGGHLRVHDPGGRLRDPAGTRCSRT